MNALLKSLLPSQLSPLGIGPHNEEVRQTRFAMQIIDDPLDQGDLGPYNEELDMLPTDEAAMAAKSVTPIRGIHVP